MALDAVMLAGVIGRLIPDDELGPGGVEAGVVQYITTALDGPLAAFANTYQVGLEHVDGVARAVFGTPFAGLGAARHDAILAQLAEEALPFLTIVRTHAIEGFFGDPRHGGNRNGTGWALIDYSGPDAELAT